MAVLGGGVVSYERGTPVFARQRWWGERAGEEADLCYKQDCRHMCTPTEAVSAQGRRERSCVFVCQDRERGWGSFLVVVPPSPRKVSQKSIFQDFSRNQGTSRQKLTKMTQWLQERPWDSPGRAFCGGASSRVLSARADWFWTVLNLRTTT